MTSEIYKHCQMVPPSKDGNFYDQIPSEGEYKETIDYMDDFSCLLSDKRFLTGEYQPQNSIELADDDSFVYRLHAGAGTGELVKSWKGVKAQKLEIAKSAGHLICTEMKLLQSLCKKKLWLSNYEKAFSVVMNMCLHENSRRKTMPNHEPQQLVRLLCQKKHMHIDVKEEDDLFVCNVIEDIMGDSSAACAENFVSVGALLGIDVQESDFRAHEDEERQMKYRLLVGAEAAEVYVLEATELKINDTERKLSVIESNHFLITNLCIVDGLIMKSLADIERMRQNFGLSTAHDYRAIMLHLLKSFILAHLENFAEKDDEEKAQAAEKALLIVLAPESDKKTEDEKSTNVGKKSKKKKPFYKRKPKNKVPSKSEETTELEKKNAEVSMPITSGGGISDAITADESTKPEVQIMLTAEIVNYERLMNHIESKGMPLVEMIKNQRQIEDEIRQNQLDEQNKEMNERAFLECGR